MQHSQTAGAWTLIFEFTFFNYGPPLSSSHSYNFLGFIRITLANLGFFWGWWLREPERAKRASIEGVWTNPKRAVVTRWGQWAAWPATRPSWRYDSRQKRQRKKGQPENWAIGKIGRVGKQGNTKLMREITATEKTATEKRQREKWATRKFGNEKWEGRKTRQQKIIVWNNENGNDHDGVWEVSERLRRQATRDHRRGESSRALGVSNRRPSVRSHSDQRTIDMAQDTNHVSRSERRIHAGCGRQ